GCIPREGPPSVMTSDWRQHESVAYPRRPPAPFVPEGPPGVAAPFVSGRRLRRAGSRGLLAAADPAGGLRARHRALRSRHGGLGLGRGPGADVAGARLPE